MGKYFSIDLSYKHIMIFKHSLEQRIANDVSKYNDLMMKEESLLSDEDKAFLNEHMEHVECLNHFVSEMKCVGYSHGINIFGNKYI